MKTAQEVAEMMRSHGGSFQSFVELANTIQQDAYKSGLLRAAQVCRDQYPNTFQASHRALAADKCARAIEAEAEKGQP